MRKIIQATGRGRAFTLVELMIVVAIVAILALLAIPLYLGYTNASVMAEGVAGAGAVRTAMETYGSQNGGYAGATMANIQIGPGDLEGKYFAQSDYSLASVTGSTYIIQAGPPSKTLRPDMPYYRIDQNGSERGTYYTNQ